jgi:hypothetical protein
MRSKKNIVVLPIILVSLLAHEVNAQVKQNRFRNTLTGASNCLNVLNGGRNNRLKMAKCDNIAGQSWRITKTP